MPIVSAVKSSIWTAAVPVDYLIVINIDDGNVVNRGVADIDARHIFAAGVV
jgi:hypothetical protein